jgi:hypothetical protein
VAEEGENDGDRGSKKPPLAKPTLGRYQQHKITI